VAELDQLLSSLGIDNGSALASAAQVIGNVASVVSGAGAAAAQILQMLASSRDLRGGVMDQYVLDLTI
jgi:hypothetical protein